MKTEDYEDASVTTEKIADKAITEGKLAEHAVTSSILGNGAVENSNIKDGSITNEKIANRTIKAFEKIARGSISQEEMGSSSVGEDELINNSVTNEKIDDEAVVIGKIAEEVWTKLKDEYLRRDGSNFMQSDLGLNDHNITGVKEIRNLSALPVVIAFNKDGYDVKFEQWSTSGGGADLQGCSDLPAHRRRQGRFRLLPHRPQRRRSHALLPGLHDRVPSSHRSGHRLPRW